MNWLDVTGPPGIGKSTLCDPIYAPNAIPIEDRLPPESWMDFCNEITRLFHLIREHPTLPEAIRMVNRSVRKIAAVARMGTPSAPPYIQTALAQRGLGFGWRLVNLGIDMNELRHYFRLMPVSIGVAFLEADEPTIIARNEARRQNPKTAHEDRRHMVPLMREPIRIAKEVLRERGVPIIEIDVQSQSVEAARAELLAFTDLHSGNAATLGHSGETAPMLSPPPWWRSAGNQRLPVADPSSIWRPYEGRHPDRQVEGHAGRLHRRSGLPVRLHGA